MKNKSHLQTYVNNQIIINLLKEKKMIIKRGLFVTSEVPSDQRARAGSCDKHLVRERKITHAASNNQ